MQPLFCADDVDIVANLDLPVHVMHYMQRLDFARKSGKASTVITFVTPMELIALKNYLRNVDDAKVLSQCPQCSRAQCTHSKAFFIQCCIACPLQAQGNCTISGQQPCMSFPGTFCIRKPILRIACSPLQQASRLSLQACARSVALTAAQCQLCSINSDCSVVIQQADDVAHHQSVMDLLSNALSHLCRWSRFHMSHLELPKARAPALH